MNAVAVVLTEYRVRSERLTIAGANASIFERIFRPIATTLLISPSMLYDISRHAVLTAFCADFAEWQVAQIWLTGQVVESLHSAPHHWNLAMILCR